MSILPSAGAVQTLPGDDPAAPLLSVDHLTAGFDSADGFVPAVRDVSFSIARGTTLGLVGESGSGKSVTALSIIRLLEPPGRIAGGTVRFRGTDLLSLPEHEMRRVRGAGIGFIFQEPMSALNPVISVGDQIAEALVVQGLAGWREGRRRAVELLDAVRLPEPVRRARDYPHQLSGGMRQRVMIAIALACRPPLVIADEPTTALDVTIQAEVLDLLRDLRQEYRLSLLLITHDLGVVAEMADRVAVMYAGEIVEEAPVRQIFQAPAHPYTRGLLASVPGGPGAAKRLRAIEGTVPHPGALPPGCAFEPRCSERLPSCRTVRPPARRVGPDHSARCLLYPEEPV
ncbi:MAG TPA: ABC transporter ATP-binding protein [Vicinamibacterales bacterium]|nr:ABC transporter ATP-binding protein [Vicinamibacterales bacterium]